MAQCFVILILDHMHFEKVSLLQVSLLKRASTPMYIEQDSSKSENGPIRSQWPKPKNGREQ